MRTVKARFGLWAAALTLAGAWTASAATPPDAWITTKAKLALITSDNVSAQSVNVDTTNGQITLHGKVRSAAEKAEAERLAKSIDGVKGVRNMLQVVSEPRTESVKVADADLKDRVEKALRADDTLKDSDIAVASVNDGVVLLKGQAKTIGDHLRAVETTARVPGVRRVASEIQSPDKVGDAEIYRDRDDSKGTAAGEGRRLGRLHHVRDQDEVDGRQPRTRARRQRRYARLGSDALRHGAHTGVQGGSRGDRTWGVRRALRQERAGGRAGEAEGRRERGGWRDREAGRERHQEHGIAA
jgi:hyperosmotically inducible protein